MRRSTDNFTLEDFKMYDRDGDELYNFAGTGNPNSYFVQSVVQNKGV